MSGEYREIYPMEITKTLKLFTNASEYINP